MGVPHAAESKSAKETKADRWGMKPECKNVEKHNHHFFLTHNLSIPQTPPATLKLYYLCPEYIYSFNLPYQTPVLP